MPKSLRVVYIYITMLLSFNIICYETTDCPMYIVHKLAQQQQQPILDIKIVTLAQGLTHDLFCLFTEQT